MIRESTIQDYEAINDLGKTLNPDYTIDKRGNLDEIIVYESGGELIAFVEYIKLYESLEILYIVVSQNSRRKGIGRSLIEYLSKLEGVEKIILEVRESNEEAMHFYENMGFKVLRKILDYYKNGECAYAMEKVL